MKFSSEDYLTILEALDIYREGVEKNTKHDPSNRAYLTKKIESAIKAVEMIGTY